MILKSIVGAWRYRIFIGALIVMIALLAVGCESGARAVKVNTTETKNQVNTEIPKLKILVDMVVRDQAEVRQQNEVRDGLKTTRLEQRS